jgi:hypothetical protein
MKLGLLAASLVLVAGGAVGCGGDSGGGGGHAAPTAKEFCAGLKDFQTSYANADPTADLTAYIKTIKQAATQLGTLGTPDDMPADAKAGFALTVQRIKALSDSATVDDLAQIGKVGDADQQKLDALDDYVHRTCPELTTGASGSPSSS